MFISEQYEFPTNNQFWEGFVDFKYENPESWFSLSYTLWCSL